MRKWLACVLALCLLMTAAIAVADEWQSYAEGKMVYRKMRVYSAPSPTADVLHTLVEGQPFDIVSENGRGWREVSFHDGTRITSGWVPASAVEYHAAVPAADVYPDARPAYVVCESLTLREEDDTASRALAVLPNGTYLYTLAEAGDWYKVMYLHRGSGYALYTGWVMKAYTVRAPEFITLKQATAAYAYGSPDAPCVALLDYGTHLMIIGKVPGYWVISLRSASAFIPDNTPVWRDEGLV